MKRLLPLAAITLLVVLAYACGAKASTLKSNTNAASGLEAQITPWEKAQDVANVSPEITKAELGDGAELANEISFATLRPFYLAQFTGLSYDSNYQWSDWSSDPQGQQLASEIEQEGVASKQETLDGLYASSFIRYHTGTLSWDGTSLGACPPGPQHLVIITTIVFGQAEGAASFFNNIVLPEDDGLKGQVEAHPTNGTTGFAWFDEQEKQNTCLLPVQNDGMVETHYITYPRKQSIAWVVTGTFVIRVVETLGTSTTANLTTNTGESFNPDPNHSAGNYASDQETALRSALPEYFQ